MAEYQPGDQLLEQNQVFYDNQERIIREDEINDAGEIHLDAGENINFDGNIHGALQETLNYHLEQIQFHWDQIEFLRV